MFEQGLEQQHALSIVKAQLSADHLKPTWQGVVPDEFLSRPTATFQADI